MKAEKGMRLLLLLCGHALVGAAELRGTTARMADPEHKNNNPIDSYLGANAVSDTRALQTTETGPFCKDYRACVFAFGGIDLGNARCCPGVDGTYQGCCGDSDNKNDGGGTSPPIPLPSPMAPSPTSIATSAPTTSPPTPFDWLEAHNKIRQEYHAIYNAVYVPVDWNDNLAADAQAYANSLISNYEATGKYDPDTCVQTLRSDENRYGGENLYVSPLYGFSPNADSVLQTWASDKAGPAFTQVIWRASKWIGCGVASSNGCFYTVCRYVAPGSCYVDGTNAMSDTSPCPPLEPK